MTRDRRWLAELDEHDRDLYEAELMYDRWLNGRLQSPAVFWDGRVGPPAEGYDPDRDDPNGWFGADERERDAKGEQ